MTPEQEDAAIIQDLVAIFPQVKEQVSGPLTWSTRSRVPSRCTCAT
jgi:hypothetical protein